MWAGFHAAVTDPLTDAGIPLAPVPGNHDASAYAGFSAERVEYVGQWSGRVPPVTFVDASHAMPCLGAGPRSLIGTSSAGPTGLVIADIEGGVITSLEAHPASDFATTVPRGTLPATLTYGSHTLTRDDL
jgi:hypothetical protein